MSLSLFARTVRRQAAAAPMLRRGYAEAPSDKIRLTLALPHQTIFASQDVTQVNIPAVSGEMGILANHVPSIETLRPGLIEITEGAGTKKFFVAGGFANVHPNNTLTINAVEAYALEDLSSEAIRTRLAEAQKVLSSSASDVEKAEAAVEVEIYETLQPLVK